MNSREDWKLEQERRKILQDKIVTDYKKNKFIKKMKSGFGESILCEPNKIQKRITLLDKVKKMLGWN